MDTKDKKILLYDGMCNLCNWFTTMIIKYNRRKSIELIPLQSSAGKDILGRFDLNLERFNTIYLISDYNIYNKSGAVLAIIKELGGVWRLLFVFYIIPKFMRDKIYDLISRYRYKLFGFNSTCSIT